jgi:putative alpha-1,2-mannosidase
MSDVTRILSDIEQGDPDAAEKLLPLVGQDYWLLHGPYFKKITVQMENGRRFVIQGREAAHKDRFYIQSADLSGKPLNRAWLRHQEIRDGATLSFSMGTTPTDWAKSSDLPPSLSLQN